MSDPEAGNSGGKGLIDFLKRTALRSGVTDVYLTSLESLDDTPVEDIEIIEGDAEGIIRKNSLGPRRIIKDQGREKKN